MPAKYHRKAIAIRVYVLAQETKAKTAKRKAVEHKKRLLKVQGALKRAHEKIEHFCSKCITHLRED